MDETTPVDARPDESETSTSKDPSDLILAYLSCPYDAAKSFIGALLITDATGRPLHFTYVSPVRPTTMQRLLYGKTLTEHTKVDVITKKLFAADMSMVPDVLFVDSAELLAARRISNVPTAYLSSATDAESDSSSLSVVTYDTGGHTADEEAIGRIVVNLEQSIDLLDPFGRIREALKEALKSDQG